MSPSTFLAAAFATALAGLLLLYLCSPELPPAHKATLLRWPDSPGQLSATLQVLLVYHSTNQLYILGCFVYLYLFLQSFAIPGSAFLSILAGPLFGGIKGFFLAQACATVGSVCCYLLSLGLGSALVNRCFSTQLASLRLRISKHRTNLFWYMLFLRMTPLVPNWFVNLAAGHVGIPLSYFALATAIGLTPNNVILIRTGLSLSEITHFGFKPENFLLLLFLGCLSLIPTLFKGKL
jgi:uncharacterized membrane protein YdjX (TVP38/TMEM64 family)